MTSYTTCPMSVKGLTGYALQRDHKGTVKFFADVHGIRLLPYADADKLAVRLNNLLPNMGPEHDWVEREGARSNSRKPIGHRPHALYCPTGRHDTGYSKVSAAGHYLS